MPKSSVTPPEPEPSSSTGAVLLLGGGLVVLVAVVAWVMWPSPKVVEVDPGLAAVAAPPPPEPYVMPDQEATFAQYAGSDTCMECHAEEFEKWEHSHHGLAERFPDPEMDEAAFVPEQSFDHGSQTTVVRKEGEDYEVVALGFDGKTEPYKVKRVIGETPLRQFLIEGEGGRFHTLEACFDPETNKWFNVYGDEDRQPGEWGHWTGRGMGWNQMCASCHNTRLRKNYDPETDTYETAMAQMTVSCESCHGPMKDHVDWQHQFADSGDKDPTLVEWTREQHVDNCAGCHARRGEITGDFVPGESFWDHYLLTITDLTNTYHPDGQVRDENYVFSSYMSSRMHHKGVRCMDCHDMHSMETLLPGNQLCMRCHTPGGFPDAPVIVEAQHTFHAPGSSGSQCTNCHMPQTTYMQVDPRHDHGWTIPDPLLTQKFGVPNACNRCHDDQSTEWALEATEEWYGDRMDRPTRKRAILIAQARQQDDAALPGLLEMLESEEVPVWKASVAMCLEPWLGRAEVRQALLDQITHDHPVVRAKVIRTLEPYLQQNDAAIRSAFEEALMDPVRSVRVAAAWALRETVDLESAAGSDLVHMLKINSDQPSGKMQLGQFEYARGNPDKAIAAIEKAIEWDPNSPPFHHDLAMIHSATGNAQKAIEKLEDTLKLAPNHAQYHYEIGLAYSEVGELDKTISSLQEAVRLDPGFGRAWYNLGLALNSQQRVEEALAALLSGERADPTDPGIPYARATILAQLGRRDEALAATQRALQIAPGFQAALQLQMMLQQPPR